MLLTKVPFKASTRQHTSSTQPLPSRQAGRGRNCTAAVDERERVLLRDPLCQVINPHLTQCKGCGAEIKLSPKMLYDTCHWLAHSGRCARPLLSRGDKPPRRVSRDEPDDSSKSGESQRSGSSLSSSNVETLEAAEYLLLLSGRSTQN